MVSKSKRASKTLLVSPPQAVDALFSVRLAKMIRK